MEEVAGAQKSYGLRRDASKERPSSFEEMLPRLLWKLLLLTMKGNGLSFTLFLKLRL